jgi:hypothetical protein
MEVLYDPTIWHWCSILRSQADASKAADLCHAEGNHLVGESLFAPSRVSIHQSSILPT